MDSPMILCVVMIFLMSLRGQALSILFSPEENAAIARALDTHKKSKISYKLCLNGIIYTNQKSWTIWLNGQLIKTGQSLETLRLLKVRIVKVTPESVEVLWTPKPNHSHHVCLKLNETVQAPIDEEANRPIFK
jgi:hypothetical protein